MNDIRTFYSVDAPAGSGKTYQAIRWAIKAAHFNNEKTVIVLKTMKLMDEAHGDAQAFLSGRGWNVPVKAIDCKNVGEDAEGNPFGSVRAAAMHHLRHAVQGKGELLMITEAAYLALPYWPKRFAWNLICDEIPMVAPAFQLRIPDHHRLLTDYLTLDPNMPAHSLVSAKPLGKPVLKSYAKNRNQDEISKMFSEVAGQILSPCYDVYTLTSGYQRVQRGHSINGHFQLEFYSLLNPDIFGSGKAIGSPDANGDVLRDEFASVTIVGACFKDSIMYYVWGDQGIEFISHPSISKGLRYSRHSCGNRLRIRYVFERPWSKKQRDHRYTYEGGEFTGLEALVQSIGSEFRGNEFIFMVNKDCEDEVGNQLKPLGGKQLSNSPYGLNKYQRLHHAAVLSALNSRPSHYSFLDAFGVDGDAVREAQYHQACYQAIMRTSLRDMKSTEPVTVIVADLPAAKSLQEQFPGAEVSGIITGIKERDRRRVGRPAAEIKKSRADIQRESKARSRRIAQMTRDAAAGVPVDLAQVAEIEAGCRTDNKAMVQLKTLVLRNFSCTSADPFCLDVPVFTSIGRSKPDDLWSFDIRDCDAFIEELRLTSQTKLVSKKSNVLVSTTAFDVDLAEDTNRGLANITRIWGVWLDIDGGEMPPDHLPKLFPHLRMAVFNSWSKGNYRVFIPTTDFMSIAEYQSVLRNMVQLVEASSPDWEIEAAQLDNRSPRCFVSVSRAQQQIKRKQDPNPIHGIDASKLTPSSLFYLPAQSADGPKGSFFTDHNEQGRLPLNPQVWANQQSIGTEGIDEEIQHIHRELGLVEPDAEQQVSADSEETKQSIIDKAIEEYRTVVDGNGRHHAFFKAIHKIHYRGGVPLEQLWPYMDRCDYDGHQRERFKGILGDLPRYAPRR